MGKQTKVKTEGAKTAHLTIIFYVSFIILVGALFYDVKNEWILRFFSVICALSFLTLFGIDYKLLKEIFPFKPRD